MITIGIVLLIAGVVLAVLGLAWSAAHALIWVGIVILIVGAVLALLSRRGAPGPPL